MHVLPKLDDFLYSVGYDFLYSDRVSIIAWLSQQEVKNYTLIEDADYGYVVDVAGNVDLSYKQLTAIKVKFNQVDGFFKCNRNRLTSLLGSPRIMKREFSCHHNKLTSLEHGPQTVRGDFYCHHNLLISLKGGPQTVVGDFYCEYNRLTNLEGSPKALGGDFHCDENKITSLEGCPQIIPGNFSCTMNKLTSLQYAPEEVCGTFDCRYNALTSFTGAPKTVEGDFLASSNRLQGLDILEQIPVVDGTIDLTENEHLGEYQKIKDYSEMKNILTIHQEQRMIDLQICKNYPIRKTCKI